MSTNSGHGDLTPAWAVTPNDTDLLAWGALVTIGLAVYLIMYLYAKFDRWAEHKSEGTPLAKTIPTLLAIALLYEIFPLDHFNILLPLSAILLAVLADWMRHKTDGNSVAPDVEPIDDQDTSTGEIEPSVEEPAHV
ncbi:MAG: hypothetical protein ACR2O3_11550 [Rhizobiaceae bacterium]